MTSSCSYEFSFSYSSLEQARPPRSYARRPSSYSYYSSSVEAPRKPAQVRDKRSARQPAARSHARRQVRQSYTSSRSHEEQRRAVRRRQAPVRRSSYSYSPSSYSPPSSHGRKNRARTARKRRGRSTRVSDGSETYSGDSIELDHIKGVKLKTYKDNTECKFHRSDHGFLKQNWECVSAAKFPSSRRTRKR